MMTREASKQTHENGSETETLHSNIELLHTAFTPITVSHDMGWWAAAVSECGIITPNVKKKKKKEEKYAMTKYRYIYI